MLLKLIVSIPSWSIILPILLLWLITLAVIVERYLFFSRRKPSPRFFAQLDQSLAQGKYLEAERLCAQSQTPGARALLPVLQAVNGEGSGAPNQGEESLTRQADQVVRLAGKEQIALLERYLVTLSTIATIAPLFGLLGTVTGMLKSFYYLSKQAGSGLTAQYAASVANGISEALITTFLGLVVAIPAYIFYNYFVRRIDSFSQDMERSYHSFRQRG
jgi:biopolymer transport protein ExbB